MNLLSGTATNTFSLLSIGHRGVGKTVFLASSYAELHSNSQKKRSRQLWFDCQDSEAQENIESILRYIVQTGQYPPPTMKVTNFNFGLKRHSLRGVQTLSHFRFWDIPGEYCNIRNPQFKTIVSSSHGCCVFIDAYALVYSNTYLKALEDIIEQVVTIASLVYVNRLKYAFAVILTKCDLLEPGAISRQQLEKALQPLTTCLDVVRANYKTFYSSITVVRTQGGSILRSKSAAVPLLWLVWELSKAHNRGRRNNLLKLITRLPPRRSQPRRKLADKPLQSLSSSAGKASKVKRILGLYLLPTTRRHTLLLILVIVGSVGIISSLLVNYYSVFQSKSNNHDMENLAKIHLQHEHFYLALPLLEKLVQQEPERLELRLQLAQLYETTGQVSSAETAYDQVLIQQKNNLKALIGKAVLRNAQGDTKTAEALFAQAEKAAPNNLKAQIRMVAQNTLYPHDLPMPPAK